MATDELARTILLSLAKLERDMAILLKNSEEHRKGCAPIKPTTKLCPECGNSCLVELRSQNLKICADCKTQIKWDLDEGQKPTFEGTAPCDG
jgi:hypothetical protein